MYVPYAGCAGTGAGADSRGFIGEWEKCLLKLSRCLYSVGDDCLCAANPAFVMPGQAVVPTVVHDWNTHSGHSGCAHQGQIGRSPMPQCRTGSGLSTQSCGLLIGGSRQRCRVGWRVEMDGVAYVGAACGAVGTSAGAKNLVSARCKVGERQTPISRSSTIATICVRRGRPPCAAGLRKKPARLLLSAH